MDKYQMTVFERIYNDIVLLPEDNSTINVRNEKGILKLFQNDDERISEYILAVKGEHFCNFKLKVNEEWKDSQSEKIGDISMQCVHFSASSDVSEAEFVTLNNLCDPIHLQVTVVKADQDSWSEELKEQRKKEYLENMHLLFKKRGDLGLYTLFFAPANQAYDHSVVEFYLEQEKNNILLEKFEVPVGKGYATLGPIAHASEPNYTGDYRVARASAPGMITFKIIQ